MNEEKLTTDHLSEAELDNLDANLQEIELLYKSRCVGSPGGSNVTVREIDRTED